MTDHLIEKYLNEAKKITKPLKSIMGDEVELEKEEKSDVNILYQLYKQKSPSKFNNKNVISLSSRGGYVRQHDLDVNKSIEIKKFPDFKNAEKYYKKLIKLM